MKRFENTIKWSDESDESLLDGRDAEEGDLLLVCCWMLGNNLSVWDAGYFDTCISIFRITISKTGTVISPARGDLRMQLDRKLTNTTFIDYFNF